MMVPRELEDELAAVTGSGDTVVAFALLPGIHRDAR